MDDYNFEVGPRLTGLVDDHYQQGLQGYVYRDRSNFCDWSTRLSLKTGHLQFLSFLHQKITAMVTIS